MTNIAEDHAAARWHEAQRAGKLRGHIQLTIMDIDELIKRGGSIRPLHLKIIRRRLEGALLEGRETPP